MYEMMLILVLGKKIDSNTFKMKLERYCGDRGLEVVQFANINPAKKSRITTRVRGSKRNLMNLREGQFFEKTLVPVIHQDGDIRECQGSGQ